MATLDSVWQFLILISAIAVVAVTVTKSSLFESVRFFFQKRSRFLGGLFSCPYCFSHWLAFAAVLLYHPRLIQTSNPIADFIVSAFALVGGASFAFARLMMAVGANKAPSPEASKSLHS